MEGDISKTKCCPGEIFNRGKEEDEGKRDSKGEGQRKRQRKGTRGNKKVRTIIFQHSVLGTRNKGLLITEEAKCIGRGHGKGQKK